MNFLKCVFMARQLVRSEITRLRTEEGLGLTDSIVQGVKNTEDTLNIMLNLPSPNEDLGEFKG